ncbi:hypothetical protein HBB16_20725 [Pseudonocardia sp. MCCB 268]|nr:hypothetical protein [Pseudonocardia cytotoxica]
MTLSSGRVDGSGCTSRSRGRRRRAGSPPSCCPVSEGPGDARGPARLGVALGDDGRRRWLPAVADRPVPCRLHAFAAWVVGWSPRLPDLSPWVQDDLAAATSQSARRSFTLAAGTAGTPGRGR